MHTPHATTRDTRAAFDGIQRAWVAPSTQATLPHVACERSIDGIARTIRNTHAQQAQQLLVRNAQQRTARQLSGVRAILGSLDGIRMPQLAR